MARMRRDGLRYDVVELMCTYVCGVLTVCCVRSRVVFVVVCLVRAFFYERYLGVASLRECLYCLCACQCAFPKLRLHTRTNKGQRRLDTHTCQPLSLVCSFVFHCTHSCIPFCTFPYRSSASLRRVDDSSLLEQELPAGLADRSTWRHLGCRRHDWLRWRRRRWQPYCTRQPLLPRRRPDRCLRLLRRRPDRWLRLLWWRPDRWLLDRLVVLLLWRQLRLRQLPWRRRQWRG